MQFTTGGSKQIVGVLDVTVERRVVLRPFAYLPVSFFIIVHIFVGRKINLAR